MKLAAGAAGAAAVAWTAPALAPVWAPAAKVIGVPRTLARPEVTVTFDDGPHPEGTPQVLDRLDRHGTAAIFFLVGEQVDRDHGLAREIADRGHTIALHGYRHRNLLRIPPRVLRADYDRGLDAVQRATGVHCELYRPPYGIFSLGAVAEVRRRGLEPLLWSRWGRDWARGATPQSIARLVLRDVGPGDVILLHDADHYSVPGSHRATVGALDLILPALSRTR